MRVAILAHNACRADAIGNQVAGKVRFFQSLGWEMRVFVESAQRLHTDLRDCCDERTSAMLWRDSNARRYIQEADVIVAEYGRYFSLLDLLPKLAGGKPRILFDYHGVTPPELAGQGSRRWLMEAQRQRPLVWCADLVLVHSQFAAKELQAATEFPEERIRQVPCYVECASPAEHAPLPNGRGSDKARLLNLKSGQPAPHVLLFVGRFAANKRPGFLIEALARLGDTEVPVHAAFIGDATDVYEEEAALCRQLALEHGLAERVHLLGRLSDSALRKWYRNADVLVIPSLHEGFCIPVIEAMAHGLPVIVSRAGALPETIGDAGLSFRPCDLDDLVSKIRQVLFGGTRRKGDGEKGRRGDTQFPGLPLSLSPRLPFSASHRATRRPLRVAVVSPRYGDDFAGGAEASLRTIARAVHHLGHHAEVFTTCNMHASEWKNHLPPGTALLDEISVHRFLIDDRDRERHLASLQIVRRRAGRVTEAEEKKYLTHSLHSTALIQALESRHAEFDAIIVGPYLFGLTWKTATRFGRRVLVMPCFHDEPYARLSAFQEAYSQAGGLLFHSEAEKRFTERELGIHHPYSAVINTFLDTASFSGNAEEGRKRCGESYLVYCGRYSVEKGVPVLLDYAGRYAAKHSDRFRFAFMGQGNVPIPRASWCDNLGFVSEEAKRDILAGARALIQLSPNESLSHVALEAWASGTPVIGSRDCAAVNDLIAQTGGGRVVGDYDEFEQALDDLWANPTAWRKAGERARDFVRSNFGSLSTFGERIEDAIRSLDTPLAEQMRWRGFRRATEFSIENWNKRFGDVVSALVELPAQAPVINIAVIPSIRKKAVPAGLKTVLIPVLVENNGNSLVAARGPGRSVISYRLEAASGIIHVGRSRLPAPIAPGRSEIAVVPVRTPSAPGDYQVAFELSTSSSISNPKRKRTDANSILACASGSGLNAGVLELRVTTDVDEEKATMGEAYVQSANKALAEAYRLRALPDDYQDVTAGMFAPLKRRIKQKLLNNFRRLYVDEISRQQTAFNEQILLVLAQLNDSCTALDQAVEKQSQDRGIAAAVAKMTRVLEKQQRRQRRILQRLDVLERSLAGSASPAE